MAIPTFPTLPGLSWPIVRTRMGKTMIQEAVSGKETRIQQWAYPKYKWSLSFEMLSVLVSSPEFQTLMGFINSISGQARPFYYFDPNDGAVTAQRFGSGDGVTTIFQLVRTLGGYTEPVIVPATIGSITVAGVATAAFVRGAGGLIAFATPPAFGATLAWTGTYAWLCRMISDTTDFSQNMSTYYSTGKIEFQNIKI